MKITINNKEIDLKDYEEINVIDLLKVTRFTSPMTLVKVNGKLVKKTNYDDCFIKSGDQIIAIPIVGGG